MHRELTLLLDENIPRELGPWLAALRPRWRIHQVEVGRTHIRVRSRQAVRRPDQGEP